MARMCVNRGLGHARPPAANLTYQTREQVLIWRENIGNRQIEEQINPFEVKGTDLSKKIVYIRDDINSPARPSSLVQVKAYRSPKIPPCSLVADVGGYFNYFKPPKGEEKIYSTEILHNSDPGVDCDDMEQAKQKVIDDLVRRGNFAIVLT